MKFIINILPNEQLDTNNLINFVKNINNQSHQSEVELVLQTNAHFDNRILQTIQTHQLPIEIVDSKSSIAVSKNNDTYWLNASVGGALLPNAIMQWENTLTQHPTDLLFLRYFNNDESITQQIDPYLFRLSDVNVNTLKRIFDISDSVEFDQLPIREKLLLLLGMQNYYLNDRNNRYATFFNGLDLLGRNVIYRVNADQLVNAKPLLAQLLYDLIENDDYVRLSMPTIVLTDNNIEDEIERILQLVDNRNAIFDEKIAQFYGRSLANRIAKGYGLILNSNLTIADKRDLTHQLKTGTTDLDADVHKKIHNRLVKQQTLASINKLF
ncbi:hypothetical protein [Nicoliella lavandulae]|uniref:Uncharacterized protein n=1 Tax=Nicoliella lavandulae TaxID=3082954 RepID=A0ABU8SLF8_9LACO